MVDTFILSTLSLAALILGPGLRMKGRPGPAIATEPDSEPDAPAGTPPAAACTGRFAAGRASAAASSFAAPLVLESSAARIPGLRFHQEQAFAFGWGLEPWPDAGAFARTPQTSAEASSQARGSGA